MKSNAPLHKLHEIARIPDEAVRLAEIYAWIDNHTANVASVAVMSTQEQLAQDADYIRHAKNIAARTQIANRVADVASEEEIDVLGDNAKPNGNRTTLVTLTVIVPEGVEHPRKRQARERAELEAKEAAEP